MNPKGAKKSYCDGLNGRKKLLSQTNGYWAISDKNSDQFTFEFPSFWTNL